MATLNILHVIPTFNDCSITRIVENIVSQLGTSNYSWVILSPEDGEMRAVYDQLGAKTGLYNYNPETQAKHGKMDSARLIKRYIDENDIHLVHTHTPATTMLTWFGTGFKPDVKRMYTKHLLTNPGDRKWGWLYTLVDRLSLYQTELLVPVSRTMSQLLLNYPGLNQRNMIPVQNAINHNYFYAPEERDACRAEFDLKPEQTLFGFAGRLEKMKRLDLLLESFVDVHKKHPEARLLIAGVGSLADELKAYADKLGVSEGLIWAGWRSDIPRLLAAMDVYVQSSVNEGLSLSLLEAMAAEKVAVGTDVGGIHEIIVDHETGIIVPPYDTKALSEVMNELIEKPEMRLQIGQAARKLVEQHFSVARMTQDYEDLYRQQANGKLQS
jgi:glycosyltransferase involved in cell wall biosynthesis